MEARQVSLAVLEVCRKSWNPHASNLLNQLQRAALSIQLNIAEGHALADKRFGNHLAISFGSAIETSELLQLAADAKMIAPEVAVPILVRSHRCERLLLGLLKRYRPLRKS